MLTKFRYPPDNSDLPESERAFAEVIGRSAAMRLSWRMLHSRCLRVISRGGVVDRRFGDFYVPKTLTAEFVKKVGNEDDARSLVARFGGGQFQLTGCRKALRRLHTHVIRELYAQGASRGDIVRASRLTDRQVRRLCAGVERGEAAPADLNGTYLSQLSCFSFMLAADPA